MSSDLKIIVSYVRPFFGDFSGEPESGACYLSWPVILHLFNLKTILEFGMIISTLYIRKLMYKINNLAYSSSLSQ